MKTSLMHRFLLHNDAILDASERGLSPGQVGLMNGWGVFSTLRVYDGVIFAWDRHWQRLKFDAERMRVPFPAFSDELEQRLNRLIEANQAWNSTLRLVVVRNHGGMWEGPGPMRDSDIIALTSDVAKWGATVKLGLIPNGRLAASEFAGAKILSWSENLTRYERAREQGFDEVLLLNERGEACECTSANIFAARNGEVWTPPVNSGCLPGITRAILLEQPHVKEKALLPADLEAADEVFITSTTRELLPVISIEGLRVRIGGEARQKLHQAFRAAVESYIAVHPRPVKA